MSTEAIAIKKVSSVSLMLGFLTIAAMMFFVQPASAAEESDRLESISTQLGLVEKVVDLLSQVLGNGEVLGAATDTLATLSLDELKAKLSNTKKDLDGSVAAYTDEGTQILNMRAELVQLKARLASTTIAADVAALKAEIVTKQAALSKLSTAHGTAKNSIVALRATIAELTALIKQASLPVQTTSVLINAFTVSKTSVSKGESVTFAWDSNLKNTDVSSFGGGCVIEGLTTDNVAVYVTKAFVGVKGSVKYVPTGAASYTLFCTSNAKDGSPSAKAQVTVDVVSDTSSAAKVSVVATEVKANAEAPDGKNYILDATIEFQVTAVDADIYIPKTAVRGTDKTAGINFRMHNAGVPAGAVTDGKAVVAFDALDADEEGGYFIVREGETEEFDVNVWYEPSTPVAVGLTLLSLNWNTVPAAPNTFTKFKPLAKFMTEAVIVPPFDALGTYTGYLNGKMFIQTKNISESDALENCMTNAAANPKSLIKCEWNKKVIYTSPAVPTGTPAGTYIGYMNGNKFIVTKNITEVDALLNCKLNAENNPPASTRCTWGTKEIFKTSTTEKGIYALDANDKNIVEKDGVTKADALKQCKAYIKKNPEPQVTCTWEAKVIYEVPGTDPATDEAIFKTSDEDPDAMTLVVDATDESDWMTIFAFDIDTDDSINDVAIDSLVVKLESPSKGTVNEIVHDARLVINGETYDDYERTGGTGPSASLAFDMDGEEVIEAGEQVTVELQLAFNRQSGEYDNGDTIRASVNGAESAFEGGDDFVGTGSVTGDTHSLFTEGLEVEVADMSETKGTNSDATTADDTGTFTFEFDVTAFETDVYIPKTALRSNTSAAAGVVYRITNGSGTPVTTGTVTGAMSSTADTSGAYYVVEEGETETFTVTVTYDPTVSGFYALQLQHIHWNSRASTPYTTMPLVPVSDFETDPLAI